MRICLVTPYDLARDGGVNRHVLALARSLRHLNHDVQVLGPASAPTPHSCDTLRGVVAIRANGSQARLGLLFSRRVVREYLAQGRFDLIHVHEPWVPGPCRYVAQSADAPLVATFHAYSECEPRVARLARRALSGPLERVRSAIAVSAAAAEFARYVFDGPMRVIPNGVDIGTFGAPRPPRRTERVNVSLSSPNPIRLLFVGRYNEPRKGLRHLLRAAELIRARGRAVEVDVAGHGDPGPFAAVAPPVGTHFLGRLDDQALGAAYRGCDVFCAPATHGESFGMVLIEAMAGGRPVVASDIRGYRDASRGAALLVPPADPHRLAEAILAASDDAGTRHQLVKRGLWRARQLTWSRVALDVNAVYEAAAAPAAFAAQAVGVPA